jgi:putative transcriptional regulator
MKKDTFEQLKQSLKEAAEIKSGKMRAARTFKVDPHNDIARTRSRLGLSQVEFARIVGVSVDTLQNWEQGRRAPSGPAKVLLKMVSTHPEVLLEGTHAGLCRQSSFPRRILR